MRYYNGNPICFKMNGNIVEIVELKKNYKKEKFNIEIVHLEENKIVFPKSMISHNSILDIASTVGTYSINYYDSTDKKLCSDIVKITYRDKIYKRALECVLNQIDKVGFGANERHHLNMIRSCNYDNTARKYMENKIRNIVRKNFSLSEDVENTLTKEIYANVYGLGILQELDDDKTISEILVNVTSEDAVLTKIYYMKDNVKYPYDKKFNSIEEVLTIFNRVIAGTNKELNNGEFSSIEVSRLNNDRVSITIPNFSENYSLNIRRFENFIPNRDSMKKVGTINDELDQLLQVFIEGELNIGIGGKMSTGKSTLINYLLSLTDPMERKAVISSVNETDITRTLKEHDILIYNVDEVNGFDFTSAFVKSLRSTSNRIIVPEARSKEFREVYKACIQTSGNIFTAHANNAEDFLNACVDMYNYDGTYTDVYSLKQKIAKGVDIIIIMHVVNSKIRIKSLSEVIVENGEFKGFNELYKWVFNEDNPKEGYYSKTGNRITEATKKRLNENGVPMSKLINL